MRVDPRRENFRGRVPRHPLQAFRAGNRRVPSGVSFNSIPRGALAGSLGGTGVLAATSRQEQIMLAARNSLKDGNAVGAFGLFQPIKSLEQLKETLGKDYAGEALWKKIIEASGTNTQRQAMIGCFVAGTLVHTREGLRPIEQIKAGDYVLSKPEDGQGEAAYKRVTRTFEFEEQETWFVSWEDMGALHEAWRNKEISREDFLKAYGNGFVITTPNHPFWVVSSDEDAIENETFGRRVLELSPPYPQRQWVRADQLCGGMRLLLADGRIVEVSLVSRVYKTDQEKKGWARTSYDDETSEGLVIDFSDDNVVPNIHPHAYLFDSSPLNSYYGLIFPPNESCLEDYPYDQEVPESWYRNKVYNLEVEDFHTYFVDTMGVWVHNNNACMRVLAGKEMENK